MRDYAEKTSPTLNRNQTFSQQPVPTRQSWLLSQSPLLQLQQRHGNQYVQRLVTQGKQGEGTTEATADVEQQIQQARGAGQVLDGGVREQMESALGANFGGVRLHTDTRADHLNQALNARAFTTGRDIFFRHNEFAPASSSGRELLAHELTHVVQQNGDQVRRREDEGCGPGCSCAACTSRQTAVQTKLTINQPGDRYEQEADQIARAVVQQTTWPGSQRQHENGTIDKPQLQTKLDQTWIQREGDQNSPRLRLPTLEVFSALHGGALSTHGRPLTSSERGDAEFVFQSSINLDAVRIVETRIANAPTTLGNNIRVAPSSSLPRTTLIHELTHIWQFQTKGTAYISDSVLHQVVATITTGDRNAAYRVTIIPGRSIHAYTAEQQAVIVENFFAVPSLRSDPDYQRMIGEVRQARPIATSTILEEAAFGPGMSAERLRPPTGRESEPSGGGNVPLVRIEF